MDWDLLEPTVGVGMEEILKQTLLKVMLVGINLLTVVMVLAIWDMLVFLVTLTATTI